MRFFLVTPLITPQAFIVKVGLQAGNKDNFQTHFNHFANFCITTITDDFHTIFAGITVGIVLIHTRFLTVCFSKLHRGEDIPSVQNG